MAEMLGISDRQYRRYARYENFPSDVRLLKFEEALKKYELDNNLGVSLGVPRRGQAQEKTPSPSLEQTPSELIPIKINNNVSTPTQEVGVEENVEHDNVNNVGNVDNVNDVIINTPSLSKTNKTKTKKSKIVNRDNPCSSCPALLNKEKTYFSGEGSGENSVMFVAQYPSEVEMTSRLRYDVRCYVAMRSGA